MDRTNRALLLLKSQSHKKQKNPDYLSVLVLPRMAYCCSFWASPCHFLCIWLLLSSVKYTITITYVYMHGKDQALATVTAIEAFKTGHTHTHTA